MKVDKESADGPSEGHQKEGLPPHTPRLFLQVSWEDGCSGAPDRQGLKVPCHWAQHSLYPTPVTVIVTTLPFLLLAAITCSIYSMGASSLSPEHVP